MTVAIIASLALLLFALPATAQSGRRTVSGTVVRIDGDELVVDVGDGSGVTVGQEFAIYRSINVRHPVTGRTLRDRFQIGFIRVHQIGRTLSLSRVVEELRRTAEVGDTIEAQLESPPPSAQGSPQGTSGTSTGSRATATGTASGGPHTLGRTSRGGAQTASSSASSATGAATVPVAPGGSPGLVDTETRAVLEAFVATLGLDPAERIARFERYVRANPNSRYADGVRREIAALRDWADRERNAERRAQAAEERRIEVPQLRGDMLREFDEGDRPVLALQVVNAHIVRGILVQVRHEAADPWIEHLVPAAQDGIVRFAVPPEYMRAPGFQYFVEIVGADGVVTSLHGTATEPVSVTVHPPPAPRRPTAGMSRIQIRSDFVDRNRFIGNDQYYQVEGDFTQRVRFGPLYAWRVGFGIYRGVGGGLNALDVVGRPPIAAGATYGYHEFEFQIVRLFSISTRLSVGMRYQGLVGGAQLRFRFGEETGISLVVGGEFLTEIGQRAFIDFQFRPLPRLPFGAFTEVTHFAYDYPDPAFRVGLQTGYQFTSWLSIAVRVSYQARTIVHAGPGGGLAVTFDW